MEEENFSCAKCVFSRVQLKYNTPSFFESMQKSDAQMFPVMPGSFAASSNVPGTFYLLALSMLFLVMP